MAHTDGSSLKIPARLTCREIEVMTWTAHGKTRAEIAIILSISEETVKYYTETSCRKLDAVNKAQAASKAIALGLIKPFPGTAD